MDDLIYKAQRAVQEAGFGDRTIAIAVARVVLEEAERAAWGTPTNGRYRHDPGRPGDWSSNPEPGSYGAGRRDAAERIRAMLEDPPHA